MTSLCVRRSWTTLCQTPPVPVPSKMDPQQDTAEPNSGVGLASDSVRGVCGDSVKTYFRN